MSRLRTAVGRVLRGRLHVPQSRRSLARELRGLRERVAGLETAIGQLQAGQVREFDRVRSAVAAATDDLTARVNAVLQRPPSDG